MSGIVERQPPAGMSIDLEDWFMVSNLSSVIDASSWSRRESRVERNTERVLRQLAGHGVTATFFILAARGKSPPAFDRRGIPADCVARRSNIPDILPPRALSAGRLAGLGATRDFCHGLLGWVAKRCPALVDRIHRAGHEIAAHGVNREPVREIRPGFHEACIGCIPIGRRGLPEGGGGWVRLLPYAVFRRGVASTLNPGRPFVFYIHPWELDPGQPRARGLTRGRGFRHTVNLERCEARWCRLLADFRWTSLSDLVGRCAAGPRGR